MDHYVYIVQEDVTGGMVKIGRSSNIKKRIKELQTANPRGLNVKHMIRCKSEKNSQVLEKSLHRIACSKRIKNKVNREWFESDAIEVIESLAKTIAKDYLGIKPFKQVNSRYV